LAATGIPIATKCRRGARWRSRSRAPWWFAAAPEAAKPIEHIKTPFPIPGHASLLERAAPHDSRAKATLPSEGRRLLTFSDSRQGTAKTALRAQLEAERNFVRSFIYHTLLGRVHKDVKRRAANAGPRVPSLVELEQLRTTPGLEAFFAVQKDLYDAAHASSGDPEASIPFSELASLLGNSTSADFLAFREHFAGVTRDYIDPAKIGQFLILREFLRRPLRGPGALETSGLAVLRYPSLSAATEIPEPFSRRGMSGGQWRDYLAICVDYFIRANSAVTMPRSWQMWLGYNWRDRYLVDSSIPPPFGKNQTRWPQATGRSRIANLLRTGVGFDDLEIAQCLNAAWRDLTNLLLDSHQDGFQLDLHSAAEIALPLSGFICQNTRRFLPNALGKCSPYQFSPIANEPYWTPPPVAAKPANLPRHPDPFPNNAARRREIERWLETDEEVLRLRALGLWSEICDRIAFFSPYYLAEEH